MHVNATGKKKKWIMAPIAGVLTAAIVGSAIYSSNNDALAKASLPGIEKIVTANSQTDPFYILEIVPDYTDASIGYLVKGEEPVDAITAEAVNDMAYKEELEARVSGEPTAFTNYADLKAGGAFTFDGAVSITGTGKTHTAYGNFVPDATNSSYYKEVPATDIYAVVKNYDLAGLVDIETVLARTDSVNTDQTGDLYLDYVYFKGQDDTQNQYVLKLLNYQTYESNNNIKAPYPVYDDGTDIYYNEIFYTVDQTLGYTFDENTNTVTGIQGDLPMGTVIYALSGDELDVFGIVGKNSADEDRIFVITDGSAYGSAVYDSGAKDFPYVEKTFEEVGEYIKDSSLIMGRVLCTVKQRTVSDNSTAYCIEEAFEFDTASAGFGTLKGIGYNIQTEPKAMVDPSRISKTDEKHRYFYKKSTSNPYQFEPLKNGGYKFVHNFLEGSVASYEYSGGFTNAEWFKQNVLDREAGAECDNMVVDVVTKKLSEVTEEDITKSKLIYISSNGVANPYAGQDFEASVAEKLSVEMLSLIAKENKAVAVEYSAYLGATDGNGATYSSYFTRMLAALVKYGEYGKDISEVSAIADMDNLKWRAEVNQDTFKAIETVYKDADAVKSHVSGSFYLNNDAKAGAKKIVSDAFATEFDATTIINGFTPVKDDIDEELFYLRVANNTSTFNSKISIATTLRYILNYGNRRAVTKTALRVLDIEPYYANTDTGVSNNANPAYSKLINVWYPAENQNVTVGSVLERDTFDKDWFVTNIATQYGDDASKIEVENVGTHEFVGRIEDLNTNYDLIYIGLDTAYMNTRIDKTSDNRYVKSTDTIYNDTTKNGLVYTHIGDGMPVNGFETSANGREAGTWNASGNDITPDKFRELKEYVQAGYTVILSNDFIKKSSSGALIVNNAKVDQTSYMYDFVNFCLNGDDDNGHKGYYGDSVFIKADFDDTDSKKITTTAAIDNISNFTKHLNISKLEIEQLTNENGIVLEPTPYFSTYKLADNTEVEGYRYIEKDGQIYNLKFGVKLKNDAAVDTTKTSYDCLLYIDSDADGRYEELEKLKGITIYECDSNGHTYGDEIRPNSEGKYELKTGINYFVTRQVPEGYKGFLAWKLEFVENGREGSAALTENAQNSRNLVRRAIEGSCAVPDYANKPTINILQLTSGDGNGTNLNLAETAMNNLYTQVKDFNINVISVPVNNLFNKTGIFSGHDERLEVLNNYDMIVMGFIDMYNTADNNNSLEATLAIREYILSGKSMLFTHDLNSTRYKHTDNGSETWGYWFNNYLRDLQGMDRFGIVQENLKNVKYRGRDLTEYKSAYDRYVTDNNVTPSYNNAITAGWNNASMLRWRAGNKLGEIATADNNKLDFSGEYVYNKVTKLNKGQITQYPFNIPDTITVADTHPQYMQLNLQTSNIDTNTDDDIVVWYCISNDGSTTNNHKYYELDFNDAINNYYIYNKGNITYTGSGHSGIGATYDDERKLFVNTLVAAYNSGTHAPVVYYKQNLTKNSATITSMYVPHDIALGVDSRPKDDDDNPTGTSEAGGWLEPTIDVNFKAVSLDLKKSYLPIIADYYIKCSQNTPGAFKIKNDWYKKITPVNGSFMKVNTLTGEKVANDPYVLENQETYTMKFAISDLLMGNSLNSKHNIKLYVRTKNVKVEELNKEDRFALNVDEKPADEDLSELSLNFTELYDLK